MLEVRVDDNQMVKQGDVLVVLDPTDFQVQVDQAEADYEKAVADEERAKKLQGNGAILAAGLRPVCRDAQGRRGAAQGRAEPSLPIPSFARPADGRIGHKSVEAGNRINAGSALMAVVEDVWVVANFKETQLGEMRVGQPATVSIDAIPGKTFRGYVDSLGARLGRGSFALLPPDNATGNFTKIVQRVPVKIRFDADSIRGYEQRIVPGLSCEPEVQLLGGDADRTAPLHPQPQSIPVYAGR